MASSERYGDGDDPAARRARRSPPGASDDGHGAAVPRVIRTAAAASTTASCSTPTRARGYSPKLSVDMASAHSWAPYTAVIHALRSISLMPVEQMGIRETAREAIAQLYRHATPFGAARRFPEGEVYVCLDRAPIAGSMQRIQQRLMSSRAVNGCCGSRACSGYDSGIGSALDALTRVDDRGGVPILYDRAVFESVFLLTWTER